MNKKEAVMKKRWLGGVTRRCAVFSILLAAIGCVCFTAEAAAGELPAAQDPAQAYYAEAWDAIDAQTAALLESLGISAAEMESLFRLEPANVFGVFKRLFSSGFREIRGDLAAVFGLLAITGVALRLTGRGANREFAAVVGASSVVFVLTAASAQVADRCVSAITLTADFVKGLLPVYAGVVAFSGNPGMALEVQTLVFAYAQTVCALFSALVPAFTAFSAALAAAAALRPGDWPDALPALVQRIVRLLMGFFAGSFVAVLSARGLLAEAADGAAVKGACFLVGSVVPVVGSAVGDALASVQAGLAMAKTGVGILGVLAVALISLPALCALILWRAALFAVDAAAQFFGDPRSQRYAGALGGMFGTLAAAVVFNGVVYITALGLVLRAKGGG